jgi:hypothetical protein
LLGALGRSRQPITRIRHGVAVNSSRGVGGRLLPLALPLVAFALAACGARTAFLDDYPAISDASRADSSTTNSFGDGLVDGDLTDEASIPDPTRDAAGDVEIDAAVDGARDRGVDVGVVDPPIEGQYTLCNVPRHVRS